MYKIWTQVLKRLKIKSKSSWIEKIMGFSLICLGIWTLTTYFIFKDLTPTSSQSPTPSPPSLASSPLTNVQPAFKHTDPSKKKPIVPSILQQSSTHSSVSQTKQQSVSTPSIPLDIDKADPLVKRRTEVFSVPTEVFNDRPFTLTLFGEELAQVHPQHIKAPNQVGSLYMGELHDKEGQKIGQIDLTWVGEQDKEKGAHFGMFGRVTFKDGRSFEIGHDRQGTLKVSDVDYGSLPGDRVLDPLTQMGLPASLHPSHINPSQQMDEPDHTNSNQHLSHIASGDSMEADQNTVVDQQVDPQIAANGGDRTRVKVMFVTSQRSISAAGGNAAMEARIANVINITNVAYINSDINMELELAHQSIINNSRTNSDSLLRRLTSPNNGYFDSIHTDRQTYSADIVAVIDDVSDKNRICGLGWIGPHSYYMVSVTQWSCMGNHTVAHEIGHNIGCHHDTNNAASGKAPAYGHRFGPYRTIMAYPPGTRTSYFSNPDISYQGLATGTNTHNNASIHNQNVQRVAAYFGGQRTLGTLTLNRQGSPIQDTTIYLNGSQNQQSNAQGEVIFSELSEGLNYTLTPNKTGYAFDPVTIRGNLNEDQAHTFTGSQTPRFQAVNPVVFARGQAPYSLTVHVQDPDDQSVQFIVEEVSHNVEFTLTTNAKSATLTFNPPSTVSQFHVLLMTTDGIGVDVIQIPISMSNQSVGINPIDNQYLSRNFNQHQIPIEVNNPDQDELTYEITMRQDSVEAFNLGQAHNLTYLPNEFNRYGHEEYVYSKGRRGRVVLLPNGEVYQWNRSLARSTLLGQFHPLLYDHPQMLSETTPPNPNQIDLSINQQGELVLTRLGPFTGILSFHISISDGLSVASEEFAVLIRNFIPTLDPLDDVAIHAGSNTLQIPLVIEDADQDVIDIDVTVQTADDLAYALDQEYNLVLSTRNFNRLRLQEHRFTSRRQVFILLPNGELKHWNNRLRENSPTIATLPNRYYEDPTRLINVEMPQESAVQHTVVNHTLTLDPNDSFVGDATVSITISDGVDSATQTFIFSTTNTAPQLDPINDVSMSFGSFTPQINLNANDIDGDALHFSLNITSPQDIAYALDQEYNFVLSTRNFNRLRLQEHRFTSHRQIFILLPNGELKHWDRRLRENSPTIATLPADYYADPTLLVDAEEPVGVPAQYTIENRILTLDPNDQFVGDLRLTVSVFDGFTSTDQIFTFSSTNEAPELDPIADQSLHVHLNVKDVVLQASDADQHPLTFSLNTKSLSQIAYELDQEYNFVLCARSDNQFNVQEKCIKSGRTRYLLMPNGELRQYNRNLRENSPLVREFPVAFYEDPALLINAPQGTPTALNSQIQGNILILEPLDEFDGLAWIEVTVSDSIDEDTQGFWFSTSNLPPTIENIANIDRHVRHLEIDLTANLNDPNGDPINANITLQSIEALSYDLDQIYNFTYQPSNNGRIGYDEKRFRSGRSAFILLPDGRLLQWNSRARLNSPLIATLPRYFYDNPTALIDVVEPQQPPVQAHIDQNTHQITFTFPPQFMDPVIATLTVDDDFDSTQTTFMINTYNQAPELNVDNLITVDQGSGEVRFAHNASDPDQENIDLSLSALPPTVLVYDLDQEYNFVYQPQYFGRLRQQEHRFRSGRLIFALLPDGRLFRWNNRLRLNSPLLTTLPTFFYDHPDLLVNVPLPEAIDFDAQLQGNEVVVNLDPNFSGIVTFALQAQDLIETTRAYIIMNVIQTQGADLGAQGVSEDEIDSSLDQESPSVAHSLEWVEIQNLQIDIGVSNDDFEVSCAQECDEWFSLNQIESVSIEHLWVSATEVTYTQYQECVDAGECDALDLDLDQETDLPVSNLSFEQATHFATWVGGRLPTTTEWSALTMWDGHFVERADAQANQIVCSNDQDLNSLGICDLMDSSAEWTLSNGEGEVRGCSFDMPCEYPAYYRWPNENRDYAGLRVIRN
jgi:hypothetical protein